MLKSSPGPNEEEGDGEVDHAKTTRCDLDAAKETMRVDHAESDEPARCDLTDNVEVEYVEPDQPARCNLTDDEDVDPARIIALTPFAPRWAPTVVVLSNLAGTGVPSG